MMRGFRLFIFLAFIGLQSSCSDTPKLTADDKLTIDTTTYSLNKKIDVENAKWCSEHSDSIIKKAVDSLIILRRKQIAKQLEDIKTIQ